MLLKFNKWAVLAYALLNHIIMGYQIVSYAIIAVSHARTRHSAQAATQLKIGVSVELQNYVNV